MVAGANLLKATADVTLREVQALPFDPGAPQNPEHRHPSEEVRVQVPQLTGFIMLRVPASRVTVHDTDTGKLLSYTLKPFPKTGISVSKTGDTLMRTNAFSKFTE